MLECMEKESEHGWSEAHQSGKVGQWADTSTGGYGKLDISVEAASGYPKLGSLMAGLSAGACNSYQRGWRRLSQYCTMAKSSPWLIALEPGRGEILHDVIMFDRARRSVLRHPLRSGGFAVFGIFIS